MIVYVLRDSALRARNGLQEPYVFGQRYEAQGELELCVNGYHAYVDPLLAVLHDPSHANYGPDARVLRCLASEEHVADGHVKQCHRWIRPLGEVPLPVVTEAQLVRYAILVARAVYDEPAWATWADGWLSGADRSRGAALEAWTVATADATAWASASWALWAVDASAGAAARAADAARAAATAATLATRANSDLDLLALARQAVAEER